MKQFFQRQWFLTALAVVLLLGLGFPHLFLPFANALPLRNAIVAGVLFVMALPLQTSSVKQSLGRPKAPLLACVVNMGLLPLAAWGASYFLSGDVRIGLLVMAAAPCTLASAAVWTRRAGGDDTVSILVTILTNLTCFVTTPFWLAVTIGDHVGGDLSRHLGQMPAKLALLVVLPMVLAQLLRRQPALGQLATRRRRQLAIVAQCGMLSMVLAGATQCGIRLRGTAWQEVITPLDFAVMLVTVLGVHLAILWSGFFLARALRIERPGQIAVAISGSQKTLMVGLHVAITYFGGLTVLPVVAFHVGQLTVDTIIADRWRDRDAKE